METTPKLCKRHRDCNKRATGSMKWAHKCDIRRFGVTEVQVWPPPLFVSCCADNVVNLINTVCQSMRCLKGAKRRFVHAFGAFDRQKKTRNSLECGMWRTFCQIRIRMMFPWRWDGDNQRKNYNVWTLSYLNNRAIWHTKDWRQKERAF